MSDKCRTCALSEKQQSICLFYGTSIDLDNDYCSRHSNTVLSCDACGRTIVKENSVIHIEDEDYLLCSQCHNMSKTCAVCGNYSVCPFEQDTENPMPKTVTKTIRNGTMVMQTEIPNLERIEALCPKCKCWMAGLGCMKKHNIQCLNVDTDDFWKRIKTVKNRENP